VYSRIEKRRIHQDGPWLTKTAAYTPIVVLSFGTKLVLMVAAVEIKVAQPKLWECIVSTIRHLRYVGKGST